MKQNHPNQPNSEICNSDRRNLCESNREQFVGRESIKTEYLCFSTAAKASIQNIWSYRKTRKLQTVKTVTFAERESFRNAYLYASLSAKAAIMHIYTLRRARMLQNPANTPFAERESFKTEYLYNLQGATTANPLFWSILKMHLIKIN